MLINLKMRASSIFKKKPVPEETELEPEEEEKLKFKWHCKEGIIGKTRLLNEEFNAARNLQPVKIMITGPPAAGKTFYSEKIHANYDIPRVHIKEIADKALKMAQTEEEEGPAFELKTKMEEAKTAAIAKIQEEAEAKGEEPPELDPETFEIPVPDDILYDLLRQRL